MTLCVCGHLAADHNDHRDGTDCTKAKCDCMAFQTVASAWKAKEGNAELLARAILTSGLSARQYAMQVLMRDERTIRRWLSGERPIPEQVRNFLTRSLPPLP